jgi:hypothetical protein
MDVAVSLATVAIQCSILVCAVVAVRRRDVAAAVNAGGALVLSFVPILLETAIRGVEIGPVLPAWLAVAGVLHAVGMLGLYESTSWWDHLTHTVSAALVAALLYAAIPAWAPGMSRPAVAAATVAGTFVVGVCWELVELAAREVGARYDIEPVLVYYGRRDTAIDLGFDIVGALLVVAADVRVFVPLVK